MVTHTRNLCSAFNPSKCIQGHLSRGIEGGENDVHSLPHQQFLPDLGLELATFWLQSDSLTIRPRIFPSEATSLQKWAVLSGSYV